MMLQNIGQIDELGRTFEDVKNIVIKSFQQLSQEPNSDLARAYSNFKNSYRIIQDNTKKMNLSDSVLSKMHASLSGGTQLQKLSFYRLKQASKETAEAFSILQRNYEIFISKFLSLPEPSTTIVYQNNTGQKIPIFHWQWDRANAKYLSAHQFNPREWILTKEFFDNEVKRYEKYEEYLNAFDQHYKYLEHFFLQASSKTKKWIPETFFRHYYRSDDPKNLGITNDPKVIANLQLNNKEHFGYGRQLWQDYHDSQGVDPTYRGEDILSNTLNIQIKGVQARGDKISIYTLGKNSLIERIYVLVETMMKMAKEQQNEFIDKFTEQFVRQEPKMSTEAEDAIKKLPNLQSLAELLSNLVDTANS